MDNDFEININNHIDFFKKYIADELFNYFQGSEVQNAINSIPNNYMCKYFKQHYFKTYNLLLAIIILACGNPHKILVDEGKIIFRSLFENILNFVYIFSFDNIEMREKLVRQFYDFVEISLNQYNKKFLDMMKNKSKPSEEEKLILSKLKETGAESKIENLYEYFKQKYQPSNKNSWSGISINKMLEEISTKKPDWGFSFYKKYYDDANPYVHCNILEYFDENGVIIENNSIQDKLELIHKSIFMFFGYAETLFKMLIPDFREKFSHIYSEYEEIDNNYHRCQREPKTLQI